VNTTTLSDIEPGSEAERENRRTGVPMALPGAVPAQVPRGRAPRQAYYEFKPYNVGRWIVWSASALRRASRAFLAVNTPGTPGTVISKFMLIQLAFGVEVRADMRPI